MNKKELINKIINKLKNLKKDKLIEIYNNFLINKYQLGGTHRRIYKKSNIGLRKVSYQESTQQAPVLISTQQAPAPQQAPALATQQAVNIRFQGKAFSPRNMGTTYYHYIKLVDNIKSDDMIKIIEDKLEFNKELTHQHLYDSKRLYNILNNFYDQRNTYNYLTSTLQIFQTKDKNYIKDILLIVKKYCELKKKIFTYKFKKNKILFKFQNNSGIILYNMALNTLDIRFKSNTKISQKTFNFDANPSKIQFATSLRREEKPDDNPSKRQKIKLNSM